ncbi:hypothetical protein [Christensenella intestinihominis]|uniref:hypothetical protein n=1 Tax=Christensenella intestinihominis TaxID=1851429 RepID=UPI000834DA13|nr:hypothetical protein [Christensenella intestinihominis]
MDVRTEIYDLFTKGINRDENRNLPIPDQYIIKRGHSPNGWYSLSNKDRIRLQLSPVAGNWDYVQLNDLMFLWYSGDVLKKLIAYSDYPDGSTRAYFEGDFHITSIIRHRIPPTVLTRKYCKICADNLLGREIRSFYVNLGQKGAGEGFYDVRLYDKGLFSRVPIPGKVDAIWPFNKWFQHSLRLHAPQYKPCGKSRG